MFGDIGWEELLIILVIIALLFGAGRVADLGGALGRGIKEFRQATREEGKSDTPTAAAPTGTALSPEQSANVQRLEALNELHRQGLLTDEELAAKRRAIVERL